MEKACSKCGVVKSENEFPISRRGLLGRHSWCRRCHSAWHKERYAATREDQIKRARAWNIANPDRHKAAKAKHRAKTREVARERSRKWREDHPGRNYEAVKEWVLRNPEARKVQIMRRRALKANALGEFTAVQLRARIEFYGGKCWMCGDVADSIDHVIPLARGGSNWPANLRPACRSCNSRKGAKLIAA